MKKFQKLFMAVAAVAGVTACTTDATEDLGVNLNGGPTTLTLSLDDTRTQLGAKDDNGIYKLTWSVDDKISVNGSVSNPLAASEANGTTATFNFEKGFGSAPYGIAYPAAEDGKVLFAAEQTYQPASNDGTFSKGAAVMYGYANDLGNVTLKHLTGILKIGVVVPEEKAGNVQLKSVRISTADRKPIAGLFDIDFATGKITETPYSKDFITCNVEVEKYLSTNPTYIHIAVPAGVYHELYVTVEASEYNEEDGSFTDGIMYATVKTPDSKPLKAGVVREFSSPITFNPINTEEVFVIKDYESLVAFTTAAKAGTSSAPVTKDAVFIADVEIPESGWTTVSAQYYTGTIYGNGYSISGLNKTLFGVLGAEEIKGLHLTNVNISGDQFLASASSGKSIGVLVAEYRGYSISHCSASGSMTITEVTGARRIGAIVGTLIGGSKDVEISYCVNRVNVTVENRKTSKGNTSSIGGIIGMTATDSSKALTLRGCVNEGAVTLSGSNTVAASERISGIGGFLSNFATIKLEDCVNNGYVSLTVDAYRGAVTDSKYIDVGGVVGCVNKPCEMTNCYNTGTVTVNSPNIGVGVYVGGLIGRQNGADLTIDYCGNSGTVSTNIDACTPDHASNDKTLYAHYLGGIVGLSSITSNDVVSSITNITISNSGKVACSGYNALTNSTSSSTLPCTKNDYTLVYAGGVIGKIYVADGITPDFTYNNWVNNGTVEILIGDGGLNDASSYFGGVAGYMDGVTVSNVQCYTTIKAYQTKADATKVGFTNVGMLTGNTGATFTDSSVSGSYEDAASVITLDNSNYFKYLFSDRTLTEYAGVTFLATKPTVK